MEVRTERGENGTIAQTDREAHDNGLCWKRGAIRDGERDGDFELYRFDGNVLERGHFRRGRKVGPWTEQEPKKKSGD